MVELIDIGGHKYTAELRPDHKTNANALIGGKDETKFIPNINISKWVDEYFVNYNAKDFTTDLEIETLESGKIQITIAGVLIEIWVLESCVEFCATFASRPNKIDFEIGITCSPQLSWEWQREFTPEEIASGRERPANVINSYAIFIDKRNNQYTTGKFGHLYRWQLTDANGDTSWAEQNIVWDAEPTPEGNKTGTLTVTMDRNWLRDAVYPVSLMGAGDTFGIEAVGGTADQSSENVIRGCAASPADDGTTTQISAYVKETNQDGAHDGVCGLYDEADDGFVGGSSALEGQFLQTAAWYDFPITVDIYSANTYAICFFGSTGPGAVRVYYDSQSGEGRYKANETYPSWPDPVSWDSDPDGYRYSIHCDYTTGGTDVIVGKIDASLTINSISLSISHSEQVSKQDLSLTQNSSTLRADQTQLIAKQDLSLAINAASVLAVSPTIVAVGKLDLSLNINATALSLSKSKSVNKQDLALSINAPSLSLGRTLEQNKQDLTLTSQSPSLSISRAIAAAKQDLNLNINSVGLSLGTSISVNKQDLTLSPQSTDLRADRTLAQSEQALNLSINSVTISTADFVTVEVNKQDLILTQNAVDLSLGTSLDVNKQDLSLSINAPLLSLGRTLAANKQDLNLSINAVTVSVSEGTTVTVNKQDLTLVINSPQLSLSSTKSVNKQDLNLAVNSAALSLSKAVAINKQDLNLSINPATVQALSETRILANYQSLSLLPNSVTLSRDNTLAVSKQDLSLNVNSSTIKIDKTISVAATSLSLQLLGATVSAISGEHFVPVGKIDLTLSPKSIAGFLRDNQLSVNKQDLTLAVNSALAASVYASGEMLMEFTAKQPKFETTMKQPKFEATMKQSVLEVI